MSKTVTTKKIAELAVGEFGKIQIDDCWANGMPVHRRQDGTVIILAMDDNWISYPVWDDLDEVEYVPIRDLGPSYLYQS